MSHKKIDAKEITGNIFEMVGNRWMLITGGTKDKYNTMTASWGGAGILWGKSVAFCFIRPQRYTREFVDGGDTFTLSFYPEKYRPQLVLCGEKSGRDIDKAKESGFTPVASESGAVYFDEAELVIVCKKIYFDDFKPENFLSPDIFGAYPDKDYHRMYIGEILEVLKSE
jgi:flavin reductase (DIM6/NTAB) family NADH-FMN oxidoreductase RutF